MRSIESGDECLISHSIIVDGRLAFEKGDSVRVEKVEENKQRPDYRYVVLSSHLGIRFQLRDADIVLAPIRDIMEGPISSDVGKTHFGNGLTGQPVSLTLNTKQRLAAYTLKVIGILLCPMSTPGSSSANARAAALHTPGCSSLKTFGKGS